MGRLSTTECTYLPTSIRLPQASQGPPTGESPHGSFLGRTMSISIRRESRVP